MRKLSPLMRRAASSEHVLEADTWIDRELGGCQFKDVRLFQRFRKLLGQIASAVGQTIPFVCQDWANTKAAYRFFSNERVDEEAILSGHFQATPDRAAEIGGQVLLLHDTTEFTYKRDKPHLVGVTGIVSTRKDRDKERRPNLYKVCGILMHSSLVVTVEGLPLGLASIKFWTRKQFKGCKALKKKINPTRVPIEKKESIPWLENVKQSTTLLGKPEKCVHICDREGDIHELFCTGQEIGTHFLIRTCVDRLAGNGDHTTADEMSDARVK
jgi:Transposase DNA-binding